jgi:hypothetical protein
MTIIENSPPPLLPLPPFETHEIELRQEDGSIVVQTIHGRLLGSHSNMAQEHGGGPNGKGPHPEAFAPERVQCFACRWTEVSIYDTRKNPSDPPAYLVHTIGRSDKPGEKDFVRTQSARTATKLLEALVGKQRGSRTMPVSGSMAFAEAAAYDPYINYLFMELMHSTAGVSGGYA